MDGRAAVLNSETAVGADRVNAPATAPSAAPVRPNSANQRPGLLSACALLLVLLAIAILINPTAGILARAIADPLAHSTSSGAALTLLVALAVCLTVIALARDRPISLSVSRWAGAGLIAGVLLAQAGGLAAHLLSLHRLDLPISLPVYHWSGASNTYSYLFHSHGGKAVLSAVLRAVLPAPFGEAVPPLLPAYDIGAGLADGVPGWTAVLCGAGVLVGALSGLVLLPRCLAARSPIAMTALFFVCSFSCLKTALDGGPLTYRFLPAFIGLVLLVLHLTRPSVPIRTSALALALLLGLAILGAWLAGGALDGPPARIGLVLTLSLLGSIALAIEPDPAGSRVRPALRRFGRTACLMITGAGWLGGLLDALALLWLPLGPQYMATHCPAQAGSCYSRPVTGLSAATVYREAGDDPLKPRATLIHPLSEIGPSRLLLAIRPLTADGLVAASTHAHIELADVGRLPGAPGRLLQVESANLPRIFGEMPTPYSAANYHVFLHLSAARLRAQGLTRFAMLPLRDPQDLRALGLLP